MAENSENIEAKLCAYVEGDLDEAGRVEIERHLEIHPNHRRLLGELTATRDLLRRLPREPAPPELAETFNGQLERSVLLDFTGHEGDAPSLRANLFPRLLATAAVLVLAGSLGVVVYLGLPSSGSSNAPLAMPAIVPDPVDGDSGALTTDSAPVAAVPAEPVMPTPAGPGAAAAVDREAGREPAPATGPIRERRMAKVGGPSPLPDAGKSTGKEFARAADEDAPALDTNNLDNAAAAGPDAARGMARGGTELRKGGEAALPEVRINGRTRAVAADPVYVIVSASDPTAALRDVTSTLASNSIEWVQTDESESGSESLQLGQNRSNLTAAQANRYAQVQLQNALEKKKRSVAQQQQQLALQSEERSPQAAAKGGGAGLGGMAGGGPGDRAMRGASPGQRPLQSGRDNRVAQRPAGPQAAPAQAKSAPEGQTPADAGAAPAPSDLAEADAAGTSTAQDDTGLAAGGIAAGQSEALPPDGQSEPATDGADLTTDPENLARDGAPPAPAAAERAPARSERETLEDELAQEQHAVPEGVAAGGPFGGDEVVSCVVAYDLTRRQAIELGELLARGGRQQVELIADQPELQSANSALGGTDHGRAVAQGMAPEPTDAPDPPATATAPTSRPEPDADAAAPRPERSRAVRPQERTPPPAGAAPKAGRPSERQAMRGGMAGRAVPSTTNPAAGVPQTAMRQGAPRPPAKIRAGERLSVTVDELAGPDTDKTVVVDVGADGTIRLPQLEPLRVAGRTRAEAEQIIADAYRNAEVIDSPTVSVEQVLPAPGGRADRAGGRKLARVPAPAPAIPPALRSSPAPAAEGHADTAPADEAPAPESPPAPAPPAPATAQAPAPMGAVGAASDRQAETLEEERIDVVILVKREAGPSRDDVTSVELNAASEPDESKDVAEESGPPEARAADSGTDEGTRGELSDTAPEGSGTPASTPDDRAEPVDAGGE